MKPNKVILIHDSDSVAVALENLEKGQQVDIRGTVITLQDAVPFGHKLAVQPIAQGEYVFKYGHPIGHAARDIMLGEHVHTHNLKTNLRSTLTYQYHPKEGLSGFWNKACNARFDGYVRSDGSVGTRNELWIIPTVGCVNTTAKLLAEEAKKRFGSRFDDVCTFTHNMGCSQLGQDQENTMKLLAGIIKNPNAGAVLILSLGCENNNLEVFAPYIKDCDQSRIRTLVTQEIEDELEKGMELLQQLSESCGGLSRTSVSAEHLVVGFKCGGSDAFSGLTANPLCGKLNDMIVGFGGSTILTEVPEMFGAETLLMERCVDETIFAKTVELINHYKDYFTRYGQTIYENPSPGNKKGGISTLEEKSLGCVQKGGVAPVSGVLGYGEAIKNRGLHLLNGSGNDQVSCTNLVASGATLLCFTTGRGNPLGAPVPTIKVASNTPLAKQKPHWIDFNAGQMLETSDISSTAQEFLNFVLEVASGKKVQNELNGYKEISIFRDGVIL